MNDSVIWYENNASDLARRYESVDAARIHDWLIDLIPAAPALVLDVGAGTGRDAAWLASRGLDVVAVEPSAAMRAEAQRLHPSAKINWVEDKLPSLSNVIRLGLSFDLILLSAVWMHVLPADRARAFRKLITLLKPGGRLAVTLRHGPAPAEQGIHAVTRAEVEALVRAHGAVVERVIEEKDEHGRSGVTWTQIGIRLPDDGTGALPLLRHIILNDKKASTYKLALLRVLCRIADGAAGYGREFDDDHVSIPLGLVALYWVRLFKPLLEANLPQSVANDTGGKSLGFVRDGFKAMQDTSHLDLRIGAMFGSDRSPALHAALRDAVELITRMPATHMTYPGGAPVLPVKRAPRVLATETLHLDEAYLSAFGQLLVPRHLWRALQRFDVWIEPALIAEWSRMMIEYASAQGRNIAEGKIASAMIWSEPDRDVKIARDRALKLLDTGALHCVWSGKSLTPTTLDVDHCFPWAAWPCDDLWNLMPAHRNVNQAQKRDRLPAMETLRVAQPRIQEWWQSGYLDADKKTLPERFVTEACATLPLLGSTHAKLDDIFTAMALQQTRLHHDQQMPLWSPRLTERR